MEFFQLQGEETREMRWFTALIYLKISEVFLLLFFLTHSQSPLLPLSISLSLSPLHVGQNGPFRILTFIMVLLHIGTLMELIPCDPLL
jgi:hypothetical protein